jgi:hypothetical protein
MAASFVLQSRNFSPSIASQSDRPQISHCLSLKQFHHQSNSRKNLTNFNQRWTQQIKFELGLKIYKVDDKVSITGRVKYRLLQYRRNSVFLDFTALIVKEFDIVGWQTAISIRNLALHISKYGLSIEKQEKTEVFPVELTPRMNFNGEH